MIIFYSTECPRCKVLEAKLDAKGIQYEKNDSLDEMLELGIQSAPALKVSGEILPFKAAIDWVNEQED